MLSTRDKLILIDTAIDEVLTNLSQGIEIKEYWIDNIKISKRTPLELVTELRKIKSLMISDSKKKSAKHKFYVFGDRY